MLFPRLERAGGNCSVGFIFSSARFKFVSRNIFMFRIFYGFVGFVVFPWYRLFMDLFLSAVLVLRATMFTLLKFNLYLNNFII